MQSLELTLRVERQSSPELSVGKWQSRVVCNGGVFLVELAGDRRVGSWRELRRVFLEAAGATHVERDGLSDGASLDALMNRLGAAGRDLPPIEETRVQTLERAIARLEACANSDTSQVRRLLTTV